MRAGAMLRHASAGRRTYLGAIAPLFLLLLLAAHANALPLQYLREIPGYIPVYIRYGDQPLEEINPLLAEAFGESTASQKNIQHIQSSESGVSSINKESKDDNSVSLDLKENNLTEENSKLQIPRKQLLYVLSPSIDLSQNSPNIEKESILSELLKSTPLDKTDLKKIVSKEEKFN